MQSGKQTSCKIYSRDNFPIVRLDNYYVHPTCTPTRAALLTGRYAANVGLGVAFVPGNPGGLEPEYATMADQFATMGYTNYLVGKWHLGNSKNQYHPLRRGFHNFYGVLGRNIIFFPEIIKVYQGEVLILGLNNVEVEDMTSLMGLNLIMTMSPMSRIF